MGTQFPLPERPPILAHICCGKMAGWIKMPLGMEVGLGPGDFVSDGDPVRLPKKGAEPPIFGPYLLWPNDWIDQDGTWHGGGPRSRRHCAGWGPSCHHPHQKRDKPPNFWPTTGRRNKPTAMAIVPNISPGDSCKVRLDQLMTILLQTYKLVLLSLKVRFF